MDRAAFIDTEADPKWWLLQPELDYGLLELRKDLSELLGWGREYQWYSERTKVEELYDLIERHSSSLLQELDDAWDDYKRRDWLTKVIGLTKPAASGPEELVEAEVEEQAPEPAVAEAAPPPAKPSLFKKKQEPAAASEEKVDEEVHAAVKDVLSHLEPEKLPALASELGISEEQLANLVKDLPADFEKMIAAEAAKLTSGGQS